MTNIKADYLGKADISDFRDGFLTDAESEALVCLFCGQRFEEGVVYPFGETLLAAGRAVRRHIADVHGDLFELLVGLGKERTGISDIQRDVLRGIHAGHSDKRIAEELGGKSASTVRNHRFHLRRQKREAMLFLAVMELAEQRDSVRSEFVDFHGDLPVQDDRIVVTTDEEKQLLKKYFGEGERTQLLRFPRKQKEKLVVLNRISEQFEHDRSYSEKEVNGILAPIHDDYVTIRRYLIDYGFLDRTRDGREYRLR